MLDPLYVGHLSFSLFQVLNLGPFQNVIVFFFQGPSITHKDDLLQKNALK